jgi:hypothetical protein
VQGLREAACDSGIEYTSNDHFCYGYQRPNPNTCVIAAGFVSDINWVVRGEELCEYWEPPEKETHHNHIHSFNDLKETIAHHLSHGASAEYTVEDEAVFQEIKEEIEKLKVTINERGGTSFVIALRASKIGCKMLLTLPLTESQKKWLGSEDVLLTKTIQAPDIHLIIEYAKG